MKAAFLVLSLLLVLPVCAHAHPETGNLPDGVAEMEYRITLETAPNDIRTRNKLGMVLVRKNKLKEAAQAFGEVLRRAPNDFDAVNGMGRVRLKEGSPAEAITWLKKASSLSGEHTEVYGDLGSAYEQTGHLAMAESSYRKGIQLGESLIKRGMDPDHEKTRMTTLEAALRNVRSKIKSAKVTK